MTTARNRASFACTIAFAAIAVLAFVARCLPLLQPGVGWAMQPDSIGYIRLADGFRADCGFAPFLDGACSTAELERTPGYPYFLAMMPSLRVSLAVQAALGTIVCLMVALFTCRLWGAVAGLIAETIIAVDLPSIITGNLLLTEALFTALITFAVLLELRALHRGVAYGWSATAMIAASVLLAASTMVRPIGQVLLILLPLPVLISRNLGLGRKLLMVVLLLGIPLATILGWSTRNRELRGVWTFSSIQAINAYYYRAAGVLAYESGKGVVEVQNDLLRSMHPGSSTGPDLWSETRGDDPRPLERRAVQIVLQHPWVSIRLVAGGFLRVCLLPPNRPALTTLLGPGVAGEGPLVGRVGMIRSTLDSPLLLVARVLILLQLVVTILTWIGVGLAGRCLLHVTVSEKWSVLAPLAAALLLLAASAGPEGFSRFRVPALPMLAMVAAFGWAFTLRGTDRATSADESVRLTAC